MRHVEADPAATPPRNEKTSTARMSRHLLPTSWPHDGSLRQVTTKDDLALRVEASSWGGAETGVEAGPTTLTGHVTGEQLGAPLGPHQLHDLAYDLLAVPFPCCSWSMRSSRSTGR